MKPTNTVAKLFSSISTLAVVAGAMALNGVTWGQTPWYTVLEQAPNPAVVTDAALRQKIVASGSPWRVQDIGTGIEMLLVPADTFNMGCSPSNLYCNSSDSPYHSVTLSRPFYLGKTEVTQEQWKAKMGSNPSQFGGTNNPVEHVSWNDVAGFNTATGFRLPTEAEWEYACRGGTTTDRYGELESIAWWGGNSGILPHSVAGKAANGFGFHDMLGNLWEYTNDLITIWNDMPPPWEGRYITYNLACGGVFQNSDFYCVATGRSLVAIHDNVNPTWGFRVARNAFPSNDTDSDGIPNATDNCPSIANPTQADCDGNGVGDACELDCNHNGFADVCEILSGAVTDQNLNGIPDTCEVSSVSRVLPISGPSTGGTAVRIIGTNFFSALPVSVTFGGAPATNVVVVSLTEITAVTPSGSPGDTFVGVNGAGAEEFYYRPSCDGDLDNNGTIDSSDLGLLLINMGDCSSSLTTPQEPMIFPIEAAKPAAVKK